MEFASWQYFGTPQDCAEVPETTSPYEIHDYVDLIVGYGDDGLLSPSTPYYYQAATQLGSPAFDESQIRQAHNWVGSYASEMLFVNGGSDPWSARLFQVGHGDYRQAYSYLAPGSSHGALISDLEDADRLTAQRAVREWAGLMVSSSQSAEVLQKPRPAYAPALDHPLVLAPRS